MDLHRHLSMSQQIKVRHTESKEKERNKVTDLECYNTVYPHHSWNDKD